MIKFMLFVNGKPKMVFYENEEQDAAEAYNHFRQFYGKDAVLNMVKYNPEDNTMTLTRLMVERKKNVRSYSGQ